MKSVRLSHRDVTLIVIAIATAMDGLKGTSLWPQYQSLYDRFGSILEQMEKNNGSR